ncbi:MAG: DUF2971 domain-containing protein [Lachnospiraceae bacterium]|nr:DUF2971 domain-containing protein [Lachnospiraceae bacterium]
MSRILYHYTDFYALNGILCEKELRVNNVLNMNDAEEMQLFLRGVFTAIWQRLVDEGETEKALRLQTKYEELSRKRFEYSAYAACFSTFRDDAAQWERYAYRGKGVCLAFRLEILEELTGGAISLKKVFYQDDVASHPLVNEIHDLIRDSDLSEYNPVLWEKLREAWQNSASFKHPSFSSENEIRLVVMPFNAEDFDVKPRYHVAKERIKKYYPLNLEEMCSRAGYTIEDLISEIIIGPESTQSPSILQDYLRDLSLNRLAEHVVLSDCPLQIKI